MDIRRTEIFQHWFASLRDRETRARIADRLKRLAEGNPGKFRNLGGGVSELKLDFGPGYRIYYVQRDEVLILLLCGGDKSTQERDIDRAKTIAAELA